MEREEERVIRVRDRHAFTQFTVHNRIIDEWYPIITAKGLALYSLYCRMAGNDEETCYPGYQMIAKHMGMSDCTIRDYNKLLVWCGLIQIEPGESSQANDYYILDTPAVTEERRTRIQEAVQEEVNRLATDRETEAVRLEQNGLTAESAKLRRQKDSPFLRALLKRLQKWRPLKAYGEEEKERPQGVRPGQLPLFGDVQTANGDLAGEWRAHDQGAPLHLLPLEAG